MGKCKYCGENAGFFKWSHKECEEKEKEKMYLARRKEIEEQDRKKKVTLDQFDLMISYLEEGKKVSCDQEFSDHGLNSFLKSEHLVFTNIPCSLSEIKNKVTYSGRSTGTSVRVMKGVSVRMGASRGERIDTDVVNRIGDGELFISNQGIYFKGSNKNIRIRYNKIAGFEEYTDGFSITKDTATAKPIIFEINSEIADRIFKIVVLSANNSKK